jgi:hypothetical protein
MPLRITGGGGIGWEEAGFLAFFWAADLGLSSLEWGDFCFLVVAAGSGAFCPSGSFFLYYFGAA